MVRIAFAVVIALAGPAAAADRAPLLPSTMKGNWFASPTGAPTDCNGDGFFMAFSDGSKKISISVTQRTGQTYSTPIVTIYDIVTPPETAPAKLGLFLKSKVGEAAVALPNNMQAEWVPAGAEKSYSTVAMYLRRC